MGELGGERAGSQENVLFFNFPRFFCRLHIPFFALYSGERKIGPTARKDTENGTASQFTNSFGTTV